MTNAVPPAAARVLAAYGDVLALELGAEHLQPLLDTLDMHISDGRTEVRLVLGAACTTAARTVDQFVAALQLPYPATRGWEDMLDTYDERIVGSRLYVVVADAGDLLRHEETDVWHRLVSQVKSGPHCLGGGFTTLVLVDDRSGWEGSRFGSAAATESAALDGRREAARRRHVGADLE